MNAKYLVTSEKSVASAAEDLEKAVLDGGFGVLHVYDLKETLHGKGVELDNECRIFEVCNPQQAKQVLDADMDMNMALPCRVSVYSEGGKTRIGMLRPTELLGMLSDEAALDATAREVEDALCHMIDRAR